MRSYYQTIRLLLFSALALSVVLANANQGHADTFDVPSIQTGGFFEVGIPDNDASFQNYFVGHGTIGGTPTPERRTFFIFDIPEFLPGETLVDATFSIYLPSEFSVVANFTAGIEVMEITSSAFSADEILDPTGHSLSAEEIFDTFGMGSHYGDLPIFASDPPMGDFPLEMIIPLSPDALTDIFASGGGSFVITARMATYDPAPGAPDELMFGLSDLVVDGFDTPLPKPFLTLVTVPEPASTVLLLAIVGIAITRRSRQSVQR